MHGLTRSCQSCPRWMNASNKNTPSMHHPWRQNVTTSMVALKNGHIRKNLTKNGEPQRYSWGTQKKKEKKISAQNLICGLHIDQLEANISQFITLLVFSQHHSTCLSQIFQGQLWLINNTPNGETSATRICVTQQQHERQTRKTDATASYDKICEYSYIMLGGNACIQRPRLQPITKTKQHTVKQNDSSFVVCHKKTRRKYHTTFFDSKCDCTALPLTPI